jgi:hypothetical protein
MKEIKANVTRVVTYKLFGALGHIAEGQRVEFNEQDIAALLFHYRRIKAVTIEGTVSRCTLSLSGGKRIDAVSSEVHAGWCLQGYLPADGDEVEQTELLFDLARYIVGLCELSQVRIVHSSKLYVLDFPIPDVQPGQKRLPTPIDDCGGE